MALISTLDGMGISLRSVKESDALFIISQRQHPRAKSFLGESSSSVEEQRNWIREQRLRPGDYYFLSQNSQNCQLGTIGLYDTHSLHPQWGRFVIKPGSKAAPASLLALLTYVFDEKKMDTVYSTVLEDNHRARHFYEWINLSPYPPLTSKIVIHGCERQQLGQCLSIKEWPSTKKKLFDASKKHQYHVVSES